ncbi:hypothetical protein ACFE04_015525 [Oxalis oulophora]
MGIVSNPDIFFSENLLVKSTPTLGIESIAPFVEEEEEMHTEEENNLKFNNVDVDDGLKTPTSLDQEIPVILTCPPAPRKPKSIPNFSMKRKDRRLLDLSEEIESLFPPGLVGGKIKKFRQEKV